MVHLRSTIDCMVVLSLFIFKKKRDERGMQALDNGGQSQGPGEGVDSEAKGGNLKQGG